MVCDFHQLCVAKLRDTNCLAQLNKARKTSKPLVHTAELILSEQQNYYMKTVHFVILYVS